jgi:hypothetical protein
VRRRKEGIGRRKGEGNHTFVHHTTSSTPPLTPQLRQCRLACASPAFLLLPFESVEGLRRSGGTRPLERCAPYNEEVRAKENLHLRLEASVVAPFGALASWEENPLLTAVSTRGESGATVASERERMWEGVHSMSGSFGVSFSENTVPHLLVPFAVVVSSSSIPQPLPSSPPLIGRSPSSPPPSH